METYFIKSGYKPRTEAATIEANPGDYWTRQRIRSASRMQRAVYQRAADLIRQRPLGARSVADVGCGYPIKAVAWLAPAAERLVAFDQSTLMPLIASKFPDLDFRPIDLTQPGSPTEQFDLVIFSDVVEHLLAPDPAINFVRSLAKTNGLVVVSTPERDLLRGKGNMTSAKPEHVREWNQDEFAHYLRARGLTILEHRIVDSRARRLWELGAPPRTCQLVVCQPG
jgi:2-polyprenyl-3-methyl-5-hydroxy-6-metoxy-1,4-benzoquinol methylase